LNTLLDFFSGKKVMITGHTGFKGSWLTFLLRNQGAQVLGYSLKPNRDNYLFNALNLSNKINHISGDIRDYQKLSTAMKSFSPDFVFHLAAQAFVKQSYVDPIETYSTNIMGATNIMESVRNCESVRSFVVITSDKCYENLEQVWGYREVDLLGGRDPYSASKASVEIIYSSYARSFFSARNTLGSATARAGNVIGGGDFSPDRIIPDCIRAIQANKNVVLRNPNSTRPWQHVLDPINGYLVLAKQLYDSPDKFQGSWNFGPTTSDVMTVKSVAEYISENLAGKKIKIDVTKHENHEANLLQLNCEKAQQLLEWKCNWDIERALRETVRWYKAVLANGNAEDVTRDQISNFYEGKND
jgi:CDP-glucose 4,6-dehydratase